MHSLYYLRLAAVVLLLSAAAAPPAAAFRVLGLFPYNARSHSLMFKALMETLVERGHEVVMLSPFPRKTPLANYTDLDFSKKFPSMVNSLTFDKMSSFGKLSIIKAVGDVAGVSMCRGVFESQDFRDLMSGAYGKFDVVFTEIFGSDCFVAVAHHFKVPLISVVTTPDMAYMHDRVGSVDNPSYLIDSMMPCAGRMNLWQRLQNAFVHLGVNWMHKYLINDPSDEVVREFFGEDTPPLSELLKKTSLVMVNNHVSINPARPVNPNVVNVGGLHLKDVRPDRTGAGLEPGLRRWMDEAEHGVIFFTLGSLVRTSSLPKEVVDGLIQAFAELPQSVLWKYESDDIADKLPPNVRIASWMPQMEVLAHPKTILFMTHGGLMGTTEAIYLGVPMLGLPIFFDQHPNVELYKSLGVAENLDILSLNKQNLLDTIRKLTVTDKYLVRAREVAARYSDRPLTATQEAVWWTEYVVRHNGAPHLRPVGADLPLYQYLLLDVIAVVLVSVLAVGLGAWLALRALYRKILSRLLPGQDKKKTQ